MSLRDAVAAFISDGATVALEGFTHLTPSAAGHEVVRQRRRDLTLVRMTPDVVYDQLIGMGCARRLVFSWGGNPGVGSLHRLRDAVEHAWPAPLEIEEHSHAAMAAAYAAGAAGLPFAVLRAYRGTDLPAHNPRIKWVDCPFTGERLAAVPAIRPDVTVIHAQQADRSGNVRCWGIIGVQKEAALAATRVMVTVEEVVDDFDAPGVRAPRPREPVVILPSWTIGAVCVVPSGAHPSYASGYSQRDNAFYTAWDEVSRDRSAFTSWMQRHVMGAEAGHA
jgi:glutaconate CoA-transferase subunit A